MALSPQMNCPYLHVTCLGNHVWDAFRHLDASRGDQLSVIYRGLWQSVRSETFEGLARLAVAEWATGTKGAPTLHDGEHEFGSKTVRVRSFDKFGSRGFDATVSDHQLRRGIPTLWRTNVSVVTDEVATSTRVELVMESDGPVGREIVGRPRVVAELLALTKSPSYGASSLWEAEQEFDAGDVPRLIHLLRDTGRAVPFIVFSEPAPWVGLDWRAAAGRVATRVQGVANVIVLGNDGVSALKEELGPLAVWGGGVRTYVPGPLDGPADAWRHRFISPRQMMASSTQSVDRIVSATCQLSTRRRMLMEFAVVDDRPASPSTDEMDALEQELDRAREDLDEASAELARVTGRYARLTAALREDNLDAYQWNTHDEPQNDETSLPDSAQDMSDAVLNAQHYFSTTVLVPDSALADLDSLDTAPNRSAWGNTAWRGFRALNAYVNARKAGFQGGFWTWCERGEADAWPASKKKLSMTESETLQNNEKLIASRLMPVDKRVAASGQIEMLAHLKIAEGGGRLAPRIYFHDDTAGPTKSVHVGFVGPHYLVPNSKA